MLTSSGDTMSYCLNPEFTVDVLLNDFEIKKKRPIIVLFPGSQFNRKSKLIKKIIPLSTATAECLSL